MFLRGGGTMLPRRGDPKFYCAPPLSKSPRMPLAITTGSGSALLKVSRDTGEREKMVNKRNLKGVFAKNERGYRLRALNNRY